MHNESVGVRSSRASRPGEDMCALLDPDQLAVADQLHLLRVVESELAQLIAVLGEYHRLYAVEKSSIELSRIDEECIDAVALDADETVAVASEKGSPAG